MIRKYCNNLIIIFTLNLVFTIISCNDTSEKELPVLPVYNPSDLNPELVDKSMQQVNENYTVADFNLINQNGEQVTQDDYQNNIYVTDFFFTRCLGICPIMTNNMEKLQEEFINNDDIKFLSISVTPIADSIPVLREYADNKGVIDSKWNITTGNKKHIYELARKSYFATSSKGDGDMQDFIHSTNFILIDKEKQIRGIYDGTNDDEIDRIIHDIKILLN